MGSALSILNLQEPPLLSKKPPTLAWSALLPEDASFIVSVSSSGVPQAEDGVTPLWALAPLLDQKLPEDRSVATFLIAAPLAPSTVGPVPKVFSVRRNYGTCLVSRCESVHTDMCVCVCVLFCVYPKENNSIRLQ